MGEWRKYRMSDFMLFNPKESIKKGEVARKITMEMLIPHSRDIHDFIYEPYNGGSKFRNGDTIVARITPCLENGKHAYISLLDEDEVAYGSTEYIVLRGIEGVSDNKFVYYLSHSDIFKKTAIKSMVGSSGRQRAQVDVLQNLIMKVPVSLDEQRRIAEQLSEIDDKIECNRKICENLEAQAQALFKHWFIDFAPFKDGKFVESELGLIPEGWSVGKLTEIADYMNGLAMQKYPPISVDDAIPVLKIKELGQSQCDNNSDKCSKQIKPEYIVKNGDVVFSWSGTLMVDIWCGGICGLNQHLFKVTSDKYPKWFYLMWTKHHLNEFIRIAKDKAVTMGHIKRGDLEKALVAIPDKSTLDKISELMNEIVDEMINTRLESASLADLRDTLLPKLMTGQFKL